MSNLLLTEVWPGLIAWTVLYCSDYALTVKCARMYQSGVKDLICFEGSYELTPYYQADIDSLKRFSPRFVFSFLLTGAAIVFLWFLTRESGRLLYEMLLGALIGLELAVHTRHLRNLSLFRDMLHAKDEVRGRVEYSRHIVLRMSAAEFWAFTALFAVLFAFTWEWFILGAAAASLSTAMKHRDLSRKHEMASTAESGVR